MSLTDRLPRLPRPPLAAALCAVVAAVGVLSTAPPAGAVNVYSESQDVEIGRQVSAEVEQKMPLVGDRRVQDLVRDIGARLVARTPGPDFPYEFKVVNASDINAFALPGGPVYINRGILEAARNEGEIAGVLAHEIAHVALRHGTERASKGALANVGWGLLGGLLGKGDSDVFQAAGGFGLNVLFLKYSREDEREADAVGARILADAGYNPADMISFFQMLDEQSSRRPVSWLSSHPDPGDRGELIRLQAQAEGVPLEPTGRTQRLDETQRVLSGMRPAPTTEELMSGEVATRRTEPQRRDTRREPARTRTVRVEPPAQTYRPYTPPSGVYRVLHPSNWRVWSESELGATLGPEGGVHVSGSDVEVVYGALLGHHVPRDPRARSRFGGRMSHEDATDQLIEDILASSAYLRYVPDTARRLRTSAGEALRAELAGRSRHGVDEHVTIATWMLPDGHLAYMLFVTPEADVAAYRPVRDEMIHSFRTSDRQHRSEASGFGG